MELIEVKSLIWAQKGKLYIIYENVMLIEKKIKYSRQAANSQSMGFAINISHAQ
jgi:hypothetical protein